MMFRTKAMLQSVLLLMLCLCIDQARAQTTPLVRIFENRQIFDLWWRADSQELSFRYHQSIDSDAVWFVYNVDTAESRELSASPFEVSQSIGLIESFESVRAITLPTARVFEDANNEFAVIQTTRRAQSDTSSASTTRYPGAGRNAYVTVLNQLTGSVVYTPLPILNSLGADLFRVRWSEDGRSFVVADSPLTATSPNFFYFVTGYGSQQPRDLIIRDLNVVLTPSGEFNLVDVLDISDDGEQLLLHGANRDPSTGIRQFRLLIWNSATDTSTILEYTITPTTSLQNAAFAPNNASEIYILDEQGLTLYNVLTSEIRVINPELNGTRFGRALFSPDSRYVALVETDIIAAGDVYIATLP